MIYINCAINNEVVSHKDHIDKVFNNLKQLNYLKYIIFSLFLIINMIIDIWKLKYKFYIIITIVIISLIITDIINNIELSVINKNIKDLNNNSIHIFILIALLLIVLIIYKYYYIMIIIIVYTIYRIIIYEISEQQNMQFFITFVFINICYIMIYDIDYKLKLKRLWKIMINIFGLLLLIIYSELLRNKYYDKILKQN